MTVADVLDRDPTDLPPIERTISADSFDYLFHRKDHPPGAYTVFPYCELWVVAHSPGTVDVFDEYRATSAGDQLPDDVPEPTTDERLVVLHFKNERYTFVDDQIDTLHGIVTEAEDGDEAWTTPSSSPDSKRGRDPVCLYLPRCSIRDRRFQQSLPFRDGADEQKSHLLDFGNI